VYLDRIEPCGDILLVRQNIISKIFELLTKPSKSWHSLTQDLDINFLKIKIPYDVPGLGV
jgi:hypothetical protein